MIELLLQQIRRDAWKSLALYAVGVAVLSFGIALAVRAKWKRTR